MGVFKRINSIGEVNTLYRITEIKSKTVIPQTKKKSRKQLEIKKIKEKPSGTHNNKTESIELKMKIQARTNNFLRSA